MLALVNGLAYLLAVVFFIALCWACPVAPDFAKGRPYTPSHWTLPWWGLLFFLALLVALGTTDWWPR